MALSEWAVPQLSKLLPLDNDSLKQIVTYADTLSRTAAAEHFRDLLGDSPQAYEFISSFQTRRPKPPSEAATIKPLSNNPSRDTSDAEVPRPDRKPRKKKQPFNQLPPARKVDDHGGIPGAYLKKDEDEYMAGSHNTRKLSKEPPLANTLALRSRPDAVQRPTVGSQHTDLSGSLAPAVPSKSRLPPSAAGSLISDSLNNSRSSSPSKRSSAASTGAKINLTGGTSMRGAGSTLSDLDSAIRQLEVSTNPTLAAPTDTAARRCNCMAQRHALLAAAPNCLSCGKIICAKEGLGPCTFCDTPLLRSSEIQAMLRTLKDERGRERQEVNNSAHRRAEVSQTARPFAPNTVDFPPNATMAGSTKSGDDASDATLALARAHKDRLLSFQTQNAKRTRIHDEAADFETPDAGVSQWASPSERALQLKRQQKVLREQEWSARPEFEKRRMVISLDVDKGGRARAVRKFEPMGPTEREGVTKSDEEDEEDDGGVRVQRPSGGDGRATGNFSRNPLLGGLIRPVYTPIGESATATNGVASGAALDSKGKAAAGSASRSQRSTWRRVQDDNDDNESMILDGGAYGDRIDGRVLAAEEPACG